MARTNPDTRTHSAHRTMHADSPQAVSTKKVYVRKDQSVICCAKINKSIGGNFTQQAHEVVLTSIRRGNVSSTSV